MGSAQVISVEAEIPDGESGYSAHHYSETVSAEVLVGSVRLFALGRPGDVSARLTALIAAAEAARDEVDVWVDVR